MPVLSQPATRGDLLVQVQVVLPANLSAEERELFHQLALLRGRTTSKEGVTV
jgi:curved DNA-binding protein